ncbi:MAG: flippase [Ignavibacteriaceae bacterium]
MIFDKIKSQLVQKEKKNILNNFFSLTVLQLSNYIIPLLVLPYLARVLGPEKFGLTAFAQAFVFYFILITDFGFNLSATREISINRDSKENISRIFSAVVIIKTFLLLISFIMLLLLIYFVPIFSTDRTLYLLTFLSVIGSVLFPQWFYQGIEKMKFITIITVGTRVIFTVFILLFVKKTSDYLLYSFLNSAGFLISGLIGFIVSFSLFKVKFRSLLFSEIRFHFLQGWHIFLSTISISLYTTSNSVLLGFFTNYSIVGYYTAAEKLFKVFQFMGMPFFQAIFPYFSKLYNENKIRAIDSFNKIFYFTMLFSSILSLVLFFLSHPLIIFIFGSKFENSVFIFSILSFILIPGLGNYMLGIQGMINFGFKEVLSKIIISFGFLHIALVSVAIILWGIKAVPFVWLMTESFIFMYEYYFLKKRNFLISLIKI